AGQPLGPRPLPGRPAAIEVEGGEAALREGVAGQVGLGQDQHAGDPSLAREHVPDGLAHRVQPQLVDDTGEQLAQVLARAKLGWITPVGVHDPLRAEGDIGQGTPVNRSTPPRSRTRPPAQGTPRAALVQRSRPPGPFSVHAARKRRGPTAATTGWLAVPPAGESRRGALQVRPPSEDVAARIAPGAATGSSHTAARESPEDARSPRWALSEPMRTGGLHVVPPSPDRNA